MLIAAKIHNYSLIIHTAETLEDKKCPKLVSLYKEKKLTMKLFKAIMETRNSMETGEFHLIGCVGEFRM